MASIPFADNYLAGSLLTLLLPICLLLAIAAWYMIAIRKVPEDTPASSPSLPPPEVVAAAPQPTAEPVSPPANDPSPPTPGS
ncbi:MAG: hypothetical protein ACLPV4_14305 [Solirubrobacteraceae bacterium]